MRLSRRYGVYWSGKCKLSRLTVIFQKIVDVSQICDIILCSAVKIPEQSYDAQYRTGGEVR